MAIPSVSKDIRHGLIQSIIMESGKETCFGNFRVKTWKLSFSPLWGTLFDPILVQLYPKLHKTPKLWFLVLLETFWYPKYASCQTSRYATSPIELENCHFFQSGKHFDPIWVQMHPRSPKNQKNMNPYVSRVILVPYTWS